MVNVRNIVYAIMILTVITTQVKGAAAATLQAPTANDFAVFAQKAQFAAKLREVPTGVQAIIPVLQSKYDLALQIYNVAEQILGPNYADLVSLKSLLLNFSSSINDLKKRPTTDVLTSQNRIIVLSLIHDVMNQAKQVAIDAQDVLLKPHSLLSASAPQPVSSYTAPQPLFPKPSGHLVSK